MGIIFDIITFLEKQGFQIEMNDHLIYRVNNQLQVRLLTIFSQNVEKFIIQNFIYPIRRREREKYNYT